MNNDNMIYLLQTREFISLGEPVYKIGQTTRGFARFKDSCYKGCQVKTIYHCPNFDPQKLENILIDKFNENFIKRTDLGREYFQGNIDDMITLIYSTIYDLNQEIAQIEYNLQNEVNNYDYNSHYSYYP